MKRSRVVGRLVGTVAALALVLGLPAAAAASAQQLADETSAWLSATLKVEVPTQAVSAMAPDPTRPLMAAYSEVAEDGTHRMAAEPWLLRRWKVLSRGVIFLGDDAPTRLLLHELLHLHHATVLEEGVVDSVAMDLIPAWHARFLQVTGLPYLLGAEYASYPAEVRLVRALSAAATGKRWRSREARLWRRALLIADDVHRQTMVYEANARAAVASGRSAE